MIIIWLFCKCQCIVWNVTRTSAWLQDKEWWVFLEAGLTSWFQQTIFILDLSERKWILLSPFCFLLPAMPCRHRGSLKLPKICYNVNSVLVQHCFCWPSQKDHESVTLKPLKIQGWNTFDLQFNVLNVMYLKSVHFQKCGAFLNPCYFNANLQKIVFKHPVRNQKLIILWHYNKCTYAKYYPVTQYVLYKSCWID